MSDTSSSRLNRLVFTFSGRERNQRASSSEMESSSKRTRKTLGSCDFALGLAACSPAEVEGRVGRRSELEVDENHEPSLPCCLVRP